VYFGVVPANAATVVYVAERTDAMVTLLLVLGLLALLRYDVDRRVRWLVAMNTAFVLALLGKEVAVALVPMILVVWVWAEWQRSAPTGVAPGGRRGSGAHWREELRSLGRAVRSRWTQRSWVPVLAPALVILAVYLVYRESALPAGGLGDRFGETQNPLSSLVGGVHSTAEGVPWEVRGLAIWPLGLALVLAVALRPRDRAWRAGLLGVALVVCGVLPLTFSGGVEPRLLYVAQIGMAALVGVIALVLVHAARDARGTRGSFAVTAAGAGLAALVLVALAVTAVDAQDQFREGSAKKLSADQRVLESAELRDYVVPERLDDIRARLSGVDPPAGG